MRTNHPESDLAARLLWQAAFPRLRSSEAMGFLGAVGR